MHQILVHSQLALHKGVGELFVGANTAQGGWVGQAAGRPEGGTYKQQAAVAVARHAAGQSSAGRDDEDISYSFH